jgi:hypothetical protein
MSNQSALTDPSRNEKKLRIHDAASQLGIMREPFEGTAEKIVFALTKALR